MACFLFLHVLEGNRTLMLGVVFLFSQFSAIDVIVFNKKFLYSNENIDFLNQNVKKNILPLIFFAQFWEFDILSMLWTNLGYLICS